MMPGIGHTFFWAGEPPVGGGDIFREGNMYLSSAGTAAHGMIRFASMITVLVLSWL